MRVIKSTRCLDSANERMWLRHVVRLQGVELHGYIRRSAQCKSIPLQHMSTQGN